MVRLGPHLQCPEAFGVTPHLFRPKHPSSDDSKDGPRHEPSQEGSHEPRIIGWREWIALPTFEVPWIKVKVDTGARTSAIHAHRLERYYAGGVLHVRFVVCPFPTDERRRVSVDCAVIDEREVRSSSGEVEARLVIRTDVTLRGLTFPIEATLARRDPMGFRMLLGREAIRGRFLVDPDQSFLNGQP